MFTGLVEEVGTVAALEVRPDGARLRVGATRVVEGLALGDSVAIDGACLTVVAIHDDGFEIDAVTETLRRTALGDRSVGDRVNLERAVRAGDRLGGHLVQGHVDGTGQISSVTDVGTGSRIGVTAPPEILRYIVEKGSITLDGVSLTVAAREREGFAVALIPHTLGETTLGGMVAGRRVNLEVDLVAKYVEALVAPYRSSEEST
jgi:riboflavin synthase